MSRSTRLEWAKRDNYWVSLCANAAGEERERSYRVVVVRHIDSLARLQAVHSLHNSVSRGHGGGGHDGLNDGRFHVEHR